MYTAIFKKVWVEKDGDFVDISDKIGTLKYDRSMSKDNEVSFNVEQSYIQLLTDTIIKKGQSIKFQYGYKGGAKSAVHKARVTEIKRKYANTISMTIKARDLGNAMKKTSSLKVWNGQTLSEICKEIAARYPGMEFVGDETTKIIENYPQSQKDDLSFLREVAKQDQSGNFEVFVNDDKLILERRGLDKESALLFEYGKGDKIMSFDISQKEGGSKIQGATKTQLVGFDPLTGETLDESATPENEKEGISLGNNKVRYSLTGEIIKDSSTKNAVVDDFISKFVPTVKVIEDAFGVGTSNVVPFDSLADMNNLANSMKKNSALDSFDATLTIVGQPNLKLNSIITMAGVLKADQGNYLVKSINDSVGSSGFTTRLKLKKNGSKKKNNPTDVSTSNPNEINDSVGKSSLDTKTNLRTFDANGQEVLRSTVDYKAPKNK